jgi:hypothetical protein
MVPGRERRLKLDESHEGAVRREIAAVDLSLHAFLPFVAG